MRKVLWCWLGILLLAVPAWGQIQHNNDVITNFRRGLYVQGTQVTPGMVTPGGSSGNIQINSSGSLGAYAGSSCSAGQYVSSVSASGIATCSVPSGTPAGATGTLQYNGGSGLFDDIAATSYSSGTGLLTWGSGDTVYYNAAIPAQLFAIRAGSAAAPNTTLSAPITVERVVNLATGDLSGDGAQQMAGISSAVRGLGTGQPVGVFGYGTGDIAGQDVVGGYFVGRKANSAGTGSGFGIFIAGQMVGAGCASCAAVGAEISVVNSTGSDVSYSATGFHATGIWLHANGSSQVGSAIAISNPFTTKFDVGLAFLSQGGGSVVNASIRDNGTAATSLDILGTHATAAINVATGAGPIMSQGVSGTTLMRLGQTTSPAAGAHTLEVSITGNNASTSLLYLGAAGGSSTIAKMLMESQAGVQIKLLKTGTQSYVFGLDTSNNNFALSSADDTFGAGTKVRITSAGLTGFNMGTAVPTKALEYSGTAARTWGLARNVTAATAGQGWTLDAGGAIAGTADLAGGNLTLQSGISTGTGTSSILFQTAPAGASGTADNARTTKMTIDGAGQVLIEALKTAGAATGKAVVCVDVATGQLYASSSDTQCLN